jgi:hypothetical protein
MFNLAYEAATKGDAKTELRHRNAEFDKRDAMSPDMLDAVGGVIDALGGSGRIGVGIYGTKDQLSLNLARRA